MWYVYDLLMLNTDMSYPIRTFKHKQSSKLVKSDVVMRMVGQ